MATLDIACSACGKAFRVRAEFAGRSTRCPGCSAPISISSKSEEPPPTMPEPVRRPKRRFDGEDDRKPKLSGDWKPVVKAFDNEMTALIFMGLQIIGLIFGSCVIGAFRQISDVGILLFIALLMVGPGFIGGIFGLFARISARRAQNLIESSAASGALTSCIGGIVSITAGFFGLLMSVSNSMGNPLLLVTSMGCAFVCTLASIGAFLAFTLQVGVKIKSKTISRSIGRMANEIAWIVVVFVGLLILIAFSLESIRSPYGHRETEVPIIFVSVLFLPIFLVSFGIKYRGLLRTAREEVMYTGNRELLDEDDRPDDMREDRRKEDMD
jgi:DNA-directed RNA polymerase subunit RPC12/RpoP